MSDLQPKVGVAAIITNPNGLVLVGKRKGSHGAGKTTITRYVFHSNFTTKLRELGNWRGKNKELTAMMVFP